ncbi:MAG: HAD-IA family hydrolase [archaeon]
MYKAIIFDIGGVIVIEPHDSGPRDSWKGILAEVGSIFGLDSSLLVSGFKENEVALQKGEMTLLDFYKKIIGKLGRKDLDPQQLLDKHLEVYSRKGPYDNEMLKLIERLKEKFAVACLSNMEPEIGEYHRRNGLMKRFAKCFISAEIGLRKPDKDIFQKAVKSLGCLPGEIVFIDNCKKYVDVANSMGMQGILYERLEKLKADLGSLGILS